MLYTLEALEQPTTSVVAGHRGRRFPTGGVIADLGCGIGGDAMYLPGTVVGVDLDQRIRNLRSQFEGLGSETRPVPDA